ncbi:tRNA dihydrouridine(20/20a) synthase DusA [Aquisalimonas lutea]|uniref:tRNA dihydrouridine(20/20a) synthase DusA n=1 Tax=Aquisalimonas lutea TaxID=1327750 RepID=UPI0025B47D4F|nr:tRNA dihydrouridine(20/20a) synthase DusA [Aquisalimonas lutea]MDN3518440.1 tRNA dihydrouridine(20/20a) synthase DusA [Aquisalimonas lutea]
MNDTSSTAIAGAERREPAPGADHRLSVAPMMDCTDRYARRLLRLVTRRTLLYTEMVPAAAIVHGRVGLFLEFDPAEHPVAVQFGGSEPEELATCARWAERYGYDEINLNVGCPSDRVQSGRFGACLMAEPDRVAACVAAMADATTLPVTVKTRIGIDEHDSWQFLTDFVGTVAQAGCRTFIVHARKAWLHGLSPKQNREVPPLDHQRVRDLKQAFPHLRFVLNGGVTRLDTVCRELSAVDGVMMGREAYHNPYVLAQADARVFGAQSAAPSRHQVLAAYLPFVEEQLRRGAPLSAMSRHLLGLFQGCPGARAWRRHISENAHRRGAGPEVLEQAAAHVHEQPRSPASAAVPDRAADSGRIGA